MRPSSRSRRAPLLGPIAFAALAFVIVAGAVLGIRAYLRARPTVDRMGRLRQYWADPAGHEAWAIHAAARCGEAPFLMPTDGLIGFVWGDSFQPGHRHEGIDIFGPTGPQGLGQTPVVAVYDAYLTRLADWHSAVILRIPRDPLDPERQIWVYYAHMADASGRSFIAPEFPPGTAERFVTAGTLLGYQGNYSADPLNPTGMHLHFSIVQDDGQGHFRNELDIGNTLDPTPYLGIEVDAHRLGEAIPHCAGNGTQRAGPSE